MITAHSLVSRLHGSCTWKGNTSPSPGDYGSANFFLFLIFKYKLTKYLMPFSSMIEVLISVLNHALQFHSCSFWSKPNDLGLCHQTHFLVRGRGLEVRLWTAIYVLQGEGVISMQSLLRWHGRHSAEVNENINLGYSQDQGYS